ncbi:MAG TPA: methylmalonyl-CoA mutase family protein [Pirellulales bacterium]|nr:methylmalonyl-CoA mutase family protein [Pirellulales bacterium]
MLPEKFTIENEFPPVTYEQWRALAEADLKGATVEQKLVTHTYEGVDIHPVYSSRDALGSGDVFGLPGAPPFVRGPNAVTAMQHGWDLRQEHAHPDLHVTNRAILEDLEGGVTSILLRLDAAACLGLEPDDPAAADLVGQDGVAAYHLDDLAALLEKVQLPLIGVALEAGAAFLPAAAMLVALWRQRQVPPDQARGAFNADPLAVLAGEGRLPVSTSAALSMLADLAVWTVKNYPHVTAVGVDTSPYHHAGATAAQDIGFAVATGVEYLRAMTAAGMDVDPAARQIEFNFCVGTHHFLAIAKLRAARWLWSRIIQAAGGSPAAGAMRINARTSKRVLTQRDPYVNLLRNTVGVFAAGVAGADSMTSVPFDAMIGLPDAFSRRVARNSALILQEEAHLHRVADPAGGSWFIDRLTQEIAEQGWKVFQQVEQQGGMLAALKSGWVAAQIDSAFAPRAKDIARRKEGITGVSEFPDVGESQLSRSDVDLAAIRSAVIARSAAARKKMPAINTINPTGATQAAVSAAEAGATIGQISAALGFGSELTEIAPLQPRYFAEPFEALRAASDAWQATHGKRPTVFLANMGPVAHHTARATYAKNFFEAGGFNVVSNNGFSDADAVAEAFRTSGATIAVICSSDKLYPELVPQLAGKLKAAGARTVVLAGNPGANEQAWRTAGVDRFIFIKCDVLATLREMLQAEGVLDAQFSAASQ